MKKYTLSFAYLYLMCLTILNGYFSVISIWKICTWQIKTKQTENQGNYHLQEKENECTDGVLCSSAGNNNNK